jgi:hypothetical protein
VDLAEQQRDDIPAETPADVPARAPVTPDLSGENDLDRLLEEFDRQTLKPEVEPATDSNAAPDTTAPDDVDAFIDRLSTRRCRLSNCVVEISYIVNPSLISKMHQLLLRWPRPLCASTAVHSRQEARYAACCAPDQFPTCRKWTGVLRSKFRQQSWSSGAATSCAYQ